MFIGTNQSTNTYRYSNYILFIVLYILAYCASSKFVREGLQKNGQKNHNFQMSKDKFQDLNFQLENLDESYLTQFEHYYTPHKIRSLSDNRQTGQYLFLLGKMLLYDINGESEAGQGKYLLAYHYLKTSAEKYGFAQSYYYLAILEYLKLVPTITLEKNLLLDREFQKSEFKEMYIEDLRNRHLHNIEHNLYISALLNHVPSSLSLGYMLKEGLGTNKNCSSALGFYMHGLKESKIKIFEFPSEYRDTRTFQENLYCHSDPKDEIQIRDLKEEWAMIENNIRVFSASQLEQIGLNYFYGRKFYPIKPERSFLIFNHIKHESKRAHTLIKFMYLKGVGVTRDTKKANELFFLDSDHDAISYETFIGLEYLGVGLENMPTNDKKHRREKSIQIIQSIFDDYISQKNENKTSTDQIQKIIASQKPPAIKTNYMKYLIGTLLISGEIKGDKEEGIFLIQQAATEGNVIAISHMALLFLEGSDLSYDCNKATKYMSSEAYSHQFFQNKVIMGQIGVHRQKYFFSLIKYAQLMIIGYRNSFINAYYLLRDKIIIDSGANGWSIKETTKNSKYRQLKQLGIVGSIEQNIMEEYNIVGAPIINKKNIDRLLKTSQQIIESHLAYLKLKVMSFGIKLHQISILKYLKYLENNDIYILHSIGNSKETGLHISQAHYLLGKYYQTTNFSTIEYSRRINRSHEQYFKASKDEIFADLIFQLQDPNTLTSILELPLFRNLAIYLVCLFTFVIFMIWKRNRNIAKMLDEVGVGEDNAHKHEGAVKEQGVKEQGVKEQGVKEEENKEGQEDGEKMNEKHQIVAENFQMKEDTSQEKQSNQQVQYQKQQQN